MDRRTFLRSLLALPAVVLLRKAWTGDVVAPVPAMPPPPPTMPMSVLEQANAQLLELGLTQVYRDNLQTEPDVWAEWLGLGPDHGRRRTFVRQQLRAAGYTDEQLERLTDRWTESLRRES